MDIDQVGQLQIALVAGVPFEGGYRREAVLLD
jgi:hypothetical protein